MMRPMAMAVPPEAPSNLAAVLGGTAGAPVMHLAWTDNSLNATGFLLQRAGDAGFTIGLVNFPLGLVTAYNDTGVTATGTYFYRVQAINTVGSTVPGYPTASANSAFSNTAVWQNAPPAAPTNLVATGQAGPQVTLTFTDNASNEASFTLQRATNSSFSANLQTFTLAANVTTYIDTTVVYQTTYFYRVAQPTWSGTPRSRIRRR